MIPKRKHRVAGIPRIESLKVENYRALRDVEFKDLTPMTVLLGPNGSEMCIRDRATRPQR